MCAAALPGFYYDEAKKKYFKILPNHIAPKGAKYSKDAIIQDQRAERQILPASDPGEPVRRQKSRVLGHPLGGAITLQREHGIGFLDHRRASAQAWARGLRSTYAIQTHGLCAIFVCDPQTGILIYTNPSNPYQSTTYYAVPRHRGTTAPSHTPCAVLDSEASSLSLSPSRVLCTTTLGGSNQACMHVTRLAEPYLIHGSDNDGRFTHDVSMIVRPSKPLSFWASAASPSLSRSDFAVGTSCGTIVAMDGDWSLENRQSFGDEGVDVLAVDWLDRNIVLNGFRDGTVRLWDTRATGMDAVSTRVKHGSCVAHVRAINEHVIVVAGMHNRLCTYDLRFLHAQEQYAGTTRPWLQFQGYQNWDMGVKLGFDVSQGLIAAATDLRRVKIFDVSSGAELRDVGKFRRERFRGGSRCLRFSSGEDCEDERAGRRLLVASQGVLEEWGWS
ncbi:hypothetical protein MMC21_003985 [Puttea exsequens]|nr:hypothetical protein [Puttea exsequens]